MKIKHIKYLAFAAVLGIGATSCDDFLDRPAEDTYNESNFYQDDNQCIQGVNYLYNSPWYDFQRGFFKVGEVLAGNYYWGGSPYLDFSVNGTDQDLVNMSYSLWAVIGHANTVYNRLGSANASDAVKRQCMGECLTWKAMAYFYLVRTFGDVPIVHDNSAEIAAGSYNSKFKVQKADVYEYIIMTLEKAMELLPKKGDAGRIDYYSAEGLMAKVYLYKSGLGMSGSRNQADLDKAAELAKDVIDNSGRQLMANYADVFRLKNNKCSESLIAWHWDASGGMWTAQNSLQSDLGIVGFDEFGDNWGGYNGPSVDLQDAFGVSVLTNPNNRIDTDARRKATMMLAGDVYDYFWQDKGGFDYVKFMYDKEGYGAGGPGALQSPTGANEVKHLYGNANDHLSALGTSASNMSSSLSTHILRLSDIYLIYAEAKIGNNASTTDQSAIDAFYAVRHRSVPGETTALTSITWEQVWKERRLELACEGDRWYDYVRLSYYDPQRAINELVNQRRDVYYGLDELYKEYFEKGTYTVDPSKHMYNPNAKAPNVTISSFTIPFPTEDVVFNPNLMKDPIHVDVRSEYSY
ncbi:RagB/SusD family nutrient uptake outer membrane protein [uncultured Bacteroides sp.]|uniref:RagB/SusD family nutrient uptake outer membrane protein n=1 Tax=uncultured Bacteroides sp. TaxID=162156 RepID=UPI00261E0A1A|nr:RagB/SusD family nutrient uptake outer membrane protein [uncultured Bacteroides sp.]